MHGREQMEEVIETTIRKEFVARGVLDARLGENVLTRRGWRATGHYVLRGELGVCLVTVFHESQTHVRPGVDPTCNHPHESIMSTKKKPTRKIVTHKKTATMLSQSEALDVGSVDDVSAERPRTALVGDAEAPESTGEAVPA